MIRIPLDSVPLKVRIRLVRGVFRRLWLNLFRKRYVRRQIELRRGECKRCTVCCQLTAPCGALTYSADGSSAGCRLYNIYRPPNCCSFPIDERDLRDRDLLSPQTVCGYYWQTPEADQTGAE